MEDQKIIQKWLNHEPLSTEEQEAFSRMEGYDTYLKLDRYAAHFKAPDYNADIAFSELQNTLHTHRTPALFSKTFMKFAVSIAAIFIVTIGLYFTFFAASMTTVTSMAHQKTTITLPDQSVMTLNAGSIAKYTEKDWDTQRNITLDGEAYFKVSKGKTFTVATSVGTVTVVGTEFNVKQRANYFEVICYEGLVRVNTEELPAGHTISIINGIQTRKKTTAIQPDWTVNRSVFTSVPFQHIIAEFERQYNVTIVADAVDQSTVFTGTFTHTNIKTALQSITIPMQLKYTITDTTIRLYPE